MDRRRFLTRSAALGCSLAASPLVTPVSLAATPGDHRLAVILLRGGMDGLGVVPAYGDPDFNALGRRLDDAAFDLGGGFAMHGALAPLEPLWRAGELGFAHAVSIPYRDKRSHFDGQDLLEAGVAASGAPLPDDGWLNRLVQRLPDASARTAYAIGGEPLRILQGAAEVTQWTPEADLRLSPQAILLTRHVMRSDPAMAAALESAFDLADGDGDGLAFDGGSKDMMAAMRDDIMTGKERQDPGVALARFAGEHLRDDARIACFSLTGWDTHRAQDLHLSRALTQLALSVNTLKETVGDGIWGRTTVVAVTEFGRTARLNGTEGTDHGSGGVMLLAGGALRGGRVIADWPGLNETALYKRRDVLPTRDLRAHLAWLLHGLYGVSKSELESSVFPDLDMGDTPNLLL